MKKTIRAFAIIFGAGFMALSSLQVTADDCRDLYQPALSSIEQIHTELSQIESRQQYRASVKRRHDRIEQLLERLMDCREGGLDQRRIQSLQRIRMALSALQASAHASAFTDFEDWLKAKQLDIKWCERVQSIMESGD